jgi:hypothetical protein
MKNGDNPEPIYPADEDIDLSEIPEFDFANAVRGKHIEWAKRANGHVFEVTDEEDAKRAADSKSRPIPDRAGP